MSILFTIKVPCQNCGSIENYSFYGTWFSIDGSYPPIFENRCSKCNVKLQVENPWAYIEHHTVGRNLDYLFKDYNNSNPTYVTPTSIKNNKNNQAITSKVMKKKGIK